MGKDVYICGHRISHRAARMLASMADHKGIIQTNDPEHDWYQLTEEHIRLLSERMNQCELRSFRGVGHLIARELEHFFSDFGVPVQPTTTPKPKPKWLPKPRWKQQQPTNSGWYWWREHSHSEPTIRHVTDVGTLPHSGWWVGPLEAPRFDASYDKSFTAPAQGMRDRWCPKPDELKIPVSLHRSASSPPRTPS